MYEYIYEVYEAARSHWIDLFFAGVLGALGFAVKMLFGRVKREVEDQAKIKAGILAILHDRLYQSCQHYMKQGYIYPGDLKNLESLQDSYKKLDGNGTIAELFSRVRILPLQKHKE